MEASRRFIRDHGLYVAGVVALLAVAVILRIPSLYEPYWYGDEGIFAAIAQNVRTGDTLYSDAWDNKPPLVFYTYTAVQSAFDNGMFALHATATVFVLATLALVVCIACAIYGRKVSLAAGAVFVVVMCTPVIEGNLAMTETFMMLPTTLAVGVFLLASRRVEEERDPWLLGAGLCLGVAMLYKQVAAFDALALVMMIWLTSETPWKGTVVLFGGLAAPLVVSSAYFLAAGAFGDYWYAVGGSLPLYADLGPETGAVTRVLGLAPAALVAWWLVGRKRDGLAVDMRHLPPLWLAFAFAGATSSSLEFPHYLQQAAPAFALTVGAAPILLPRDPHDRLLVAAATLCMAGAFLLQFGEPLYERRQVHPVPYYRNYLAYTFGDRDHQTYERFFDGKAESVRDISTTMREDGAGTTLYTWSEFPWTYAVGEYENPTSYYTSFLGELVPGAKADVLADLDREPPAYIVLSDTTYAPFDGLEEWMSGRYVLAHEQGDWRLYRLGTLAGKLAPIEPSPTVESS